MAGHELITAHLDALAARLPAPAVEELADGLWETYDRRLAGSGDPEQAARAAIAEFGDADTIIAAFVRDSPWRRTALLLLATAPIMAAAWGTTLLTAHPWASAIPLAARIGYGAAVAMIAATLLAVAYERRAYRQTRPATVAAALGLLTVDGLAVVAVTTMTAAPTWPMVLAISASLTRIFLTLRAVPVLVSR